MTRPYIIPLDLGDKISEKSTYYVRRYVGEKEPSKNLAAYIGGAAKKIVIDAGVPPMERVLKYHPYVKHLPVKPDQTIVPQLAKIGVRPEEVEIVILTHLHWDHVGEVDRFPNAHFIVSEEELRFAVNPLPPQYKDYEALQAGADPLFMKIIPRMTTVEFKEREIVEGVRLLPLPGHTQGLMGVVIDTEAGPHVFAGDAVPKYGNLKGAPEEHLKYLMIGIYTDMKAAWKSFETIDEIVKGDFSRVLPGHDPLVFQKLRYP